VKPSTTRDVCSSLKPALHLALAAAFVKLTLHILTNLCQTHLGYGYLRDELYYLVCGQHLSWGYVDQAPMVALQAKLSVFLFGPSLAGIRMLSALAGAGRVFLCVILCWQLGGRRAAQALAALCALMAPQYLGLDSFLSMNSFESLFWLSFLILVIKVQHDQDPRYWPLAGLIASFGVLNKPSILFFLAAFLLAILLTPQRRILFNRYFLLAILLASIVVLPYVLWQAHHDWPTWQYLRLQRGSGKYVPLTFLDRLQSPIDNLLPITLPVWIAGLYLTLRDPSRQQLAWIGLTFLLLFALLTSLGAKDYYVAPIYPVLFSAGAVFWQEHFARPALARWRRPAFTTFATATIIYGLIVLPMAIPIVPPSAWSTYLRLTHQHTEERETVAVTTLPQWFADRFGWDELAAQVLRIVDGLPAQDRSHLGILCDNYGEASAINFIDRKANLPFAISPHNTYFLWGTNGYTGNNLLLVTSQSPAELRQAYARVTQVGQMQNPLALPSEQKAIYLVQGRIRPLSQDWQSYRFYY